MADEVLVHCLDGRDIYERKETHGVRVLYSFEDTNFFAVFSVYVYLQRSLNFSSPVKI